VSGEGHPVYEAFTIRMTIADRIVGKGGSAV
jgi:hypothetical protein